MAEVTITITDEEGGGVFVKFDSVPPVDTSDMDAATDAQLLGLGFIAETVQSAASINHFSANGEELNLS